MSLLHFLSLVTEGRMETCVVSLESETAAGDRIYYKCLAKSSEQLVIVGLEHCDKNQLLPFLWQIASGIIANGTRYNCLISGRNEPGRLYIHGTKTEYVLRF